MTQHPAGLAIAIAVGLLLLPVAPHAATLGLALFAARAISVRLDGAATGGGPADVPAAWVRTGLVAVPLVIGLLLVETAPHAATLGLAALATAVIYARLR